MDQMADIMQQRGYHQGRSRIRVLSEPSRLQRVLALRNTFAEICIVSAGLE
jgi:hypothetical protein